MHQKSVRAGGFTLIEMMIVVVIIGILASIAIPQFLRYQLKSKTSEATRNIGAIRIVEETFAAKWGMFALASGVPTPGPGATKQAWDPPADAGFSILGFIPTGKVYYQYAVGTGSTVPSTGAAGFSDDTTFDTTSGDPVGVVATRDPDIIVVATGDLDGDLTLGSYYLNDESSAIAGDPVTTGEMVF